MQFQSYAYGKNHYELDPDLKVLLRHYWPEYTQHERALAQFGEFAGGRAYEVAYHIDHDARPVLVMHDLDGRRVDRVRLAPAHEEVLKQLVPINRPPYEGGSWHHHYALGFLLADPGLYCELTITNSTLYVIHKYAPGQAQWKEKLLRGEAWGATWMTEVQGGSDLGANTTHARQDGDGWRLQGEKYFCSGCGLADIAIVTAHPEGAPPGPKGIALFLVPRLNRNGELNYFVRRLKDKSATRAVTSGEVEFHDTEAYLVGEQAQGIYYTLESLLVSRLANAAAAMGIARKAHLEAWYRTQRRQAFGKTINQHPLVRRDLTDLAVRMAGGLALTFHAVELFNRAWHDSPPYSNAYHYARFLAHLAKNRTAEHASAVTQLAMELFGGIGFLEEFAVARWHREALITPIWEGTSNIQALDMLESITRKRAHQGFLEEFIPILRKIDTPEAHSAREAISKTLAHLAQINADEAQWYAKHALTRLADAAQVALLYRLAETGGERYAKLAQLYARRFLFMEEYPAWAMQDAEIWAFTADEYL